MPYLDNPPPPDRFVRRWLVVAATLAALMLLWQFLPALEAWFAPREGAPRTVVARANCIADLCGAVFHRIRETIASFQVWR